MSLSCGGFSHALQGCSATLSSAPAVVTTKNIFTMALGGKSRLEQKQYWTGTSCRFPPSLTYVLTLPAAKLYSSMESHPFATISGSCSCLWESATLGLWALLLPTSIKTASSVRTRPICNNEGRAGIQKQTLERINMGRRKCDLSKWSSQDFFLY